MANLDPIKVYDARWEAADLADGEVEQLFRATFAYGRELGVDTVVICRDARLAAGRVQSIGVEAAVAAGLRVFVCTAPVSTPQSYFATLWHTRQRPGTMGLTVTASHNPASYIGLKFTVPVVRAIGFNSGPQGGLARVKQLYTQLPASDPPARGDVRFFDLGAEYVGYSLAAAGLAPGALQGMRVVLDGFHGSAGPELHSCLSAAGVEVIGRRLVPDGSFPGGSPNPTSAGKLDETVALCAATGADAFVALDGDGDRLVFGDQRGALTAGFAMLGVLTAARLPAGAKVLYDPKVAPSALAEWGRMDVAPVLFRNGHSQIKDYMLTIGAAAAAEESGHYYHELRLDGLRICAENSALTTLLFLQALRDQIGLLDRLWELQNQLYTTGEFNYQFASDEQRDAALRSLVAQLAADGAELVTHTPEGIDLEGTALSRGVALIPGEVTLDAGWYSGYVRASTNERAVLRAYFSTADATGGRLLEHSVRTLLSEQYGGQPVE